MNSLQAEVYNAVNIDHLVSSVVHGYNSTVMAYGQTGAGKTYTLQGMNLILCCSI
jgi:hypothetical protein